MGRKALPKLNPDVDFSKHFFTPEALETQPDLQSYFPVQQPLEVEVGTGKGLFMKNASGMTPGHNFLGIEIAFKYARFAGYKLAKEGRTNAVMFHGDGQKIFRETIPAESLEAVHVYFPDPWWKARHHRRRLMNEEFCQQIERVLRVGGKLHFWTDVLDYFEMAVESLHKVTKLQGPIDVDESPAEHDLDYRTHFERRMRKNEMDVFRSQFVKQEPVA
ncbi:tRNA (guanosine(46)-N7)-methyltransferase TrmB [Bremerella sp. JC817]|uniref:tRNA (guanosine(46)-N7)-methyltransferase TrmB n=1 Tax=Bremerella sp. JC817 TaxID=3231756 RepID=UPI003457F0BC